MHFGCTINNKKQSMKKAWVEFLGEQPNLVADRVE